MGDYSRACLTVTAVIGTLLLLSRSGASQLPCTHPLRISAPQLFPHCNGANTCTYSAYSDWQTDSSSAERTVSTSQCPSGKMYQEIRRRTSTGGTLCTDLTQTRRVCKSCTIQANIQHKLSTILSADIIYITGAPDQEDKLIIALGLGGSGQDLKAVNKPSIPLRPYTTTTFSRLRQKPIKPLKKCPKNNNVGQICHHLTGIINIPYITHIFHEIALKSLQKSIHECHEFAIAPGHALKF